MENVEQFKGQIISLLGEGYTVGVRGDYFLVKKGDVTASILLENTIFKGWSRPWKVQFGFKSTRYSTLKKAVGVIKSKFESKTKELALRANVEHLRATRNQVIEDKLKERGVTLKTTTEYYRVGTGYSSYTVNKAVEVIYPGEKEYSPLVKVEGKIEDNEEKDFVITNVIITGKFTLDQFKKLTDTVKLLDIAKDY